MGTNTEKKLLEALVIPENHNLSIDKLCKKIGIAKQTYYNVVRKPSFVVQYRKMLSGLLTPSLYPILKKCIDQAKEGSFYHQQLIFRMAGLYRDRLQVDLGLNVKGQISHTVDFEAFQKAITAFRDNLDMRREKTIEVDVKKLGDVPESAKAELKELEYVPEKE